MTNVCRPSWFSQKLLRLQERRKALRVLLPVATAGCLFTYLPPPKKKVVEIEISGVYRPFRIKLSESERAELNDVLLLAAGGGAAFHNHPLTG